MVKKQEGVVLCSLFRVELLKVGELSPRYSPSIVPNSRISREAHPLGVAESHQHTDSEK